MSSAASVLMELFIRCCLLLLLPLCADFVSRSLFCGGVVLNVLSGFTIILLRKIENWLLYFKCLLGVIWLLVFCVASAWCPGLVGAFPGHTNFLFEF